MADSVFDASFVGKANGPTQAEMEGNFLHRRLTAMRSVTSGARRVRYNSKLLQEYRQIVRVYRNDVIDQFFELLDSPRAVLVARNTLSRQDKAKAVSCRWPSHDQHVLAAARGGTEVIIHVTENALGACSANVRRIFGFQVNHIS